VVGCLVEFNGNKLYLVSVYVPCCGKSKTRLAANMAILNEVEKLVMNMKAKRHEVIVSSDLKFIRDEFLDADGGSPEIYKEQLEWIDRMAKYCGMFDAMHFLRPNERLYSWSRPADKIHRRLDYIFCSRKMLERACDTSIVAVPQTDHRLLVMGLDLLPILPRALPSGSAVAVLGQRLRPQQHSQNVRFFLLIQCL
jgi:exonuclease III